jgi:bacterial/archaeal transporter family protein
MGNDQSASIHHHSIRRSVTSSPSAAFGRIRISSPNVNKVVADHVASVRSLRRESFQSLLSTPTNNNNHNHINLQYGTASGLDHVLLGWTEQQQQQQQQTPMQAPSSSSLFTPLNHKRLETIPSVSSSFENGSREFSANDFTSLQDSPPSFTGQYKDFHRALSSSDDGGIMAPPWYIWMGPALICALMYALYNILYVLIRWWLYDDDDDDDNGFTASFLSFVVVVVFFYLNSSLLFVLFACRNVSPPPPETQQKHSSIKKGSASIHPILGGVILQFVAAILGTILLLVIVAKSDNGFEDLPYDMDGIKWAICAGAAVGAAEIISFIVSGMGVQAMQSIPIIIGGSVLFGTVMGATLLGEMLTTRGWFGVVLIAAGITMVGMDPGCSIH